MFCSVPTVQSNTIPPRPFLNGIIESKPNNTSPNIHPTSIATFNSPFLSVSPSDSQAAQPVAHLARNRFAR